MVRNISGSILPLILPKEKSHQNRNSDPENQRQGSGATQRAGFAVPATGVVSLIRQ